jgi:hypothetical protein
LHTPNFTNATSFVSRRRQNLLPLNAKTRKSPYNCTRRAAQVKRFSARGQKFLAEAAPTRRKSIFFNV